jgi:hypothetical protein
MNSRRNKMSKQITFKIDGDFPLTSLEVKELMFFIETMLEQALKGQISTFFQVVPKMRPIMNKIHAWRENKK